MRQIVLDTETTGLSPEDGHRVIEIGCIEIVGRRLTGRSLHLYMNPERDIDAGALEGIVAMVARGMDMERPDLLIVNRFGKLEAAGRGFCPLIVQALEDGVPVVVGVNALNRPSFDAFAGCLAQELPDGIAEVLDWAEQFLDRAAA